MLAVCIITASGARAQQSKGSKATASLQQEESRLTRQKDALLNKTMRESALRDSLGKQLSGTQNARKSYWTTLTSERREKADSLDKVIVKQAHLYDSVQRLFDHCLVLLDSTVGLLNAVKEKRALKKE